MALQKTINYNGFDLTYHNFGPIRAFPGYGGDQVELKVLSYATKAAYDSGVEGFKAVPDLIICKNDTASLDINGNIREQAYTYLKTLTDFQGVDWTDAIDA